MSDVKIYDIKPEIAANAHITAESYKALYQRSIAEPEAFWTEQAEQFLDWSKPWDKVMDCDFKTGHIRWFGGGKLNVSVNCLDRHLATRADQVAIIWEGDNPAQDKKNHLPAIARTSLQVCQCVKNARRQQRRPRLHLPADD